MKQALLLVACLLMVACAPRSEQTRAAVPDPAVLSPDQQMADFLGSGQPGTAASFSGTSYGAHGTVTVREEYVSALGELCREGLLNGSGGTTRIAACRDREGKHAWRLTPAIFGQGAL